MILLFKITLLITTFLLALIAGLFYAYSCSVNPGLGRLSDTEYLRAMQSINRAILNPWFFASFLGTLIMLPVSTWISYNAGGTSSLFYLLLAATMIYAIGVFGVTGFGNVPLNEALDRFEIGNATLQEIKKQRLAFELAWNKYHMIRTLANLLSLMLVLWAIIKK